MRILLLNYEFPPMGGGAGWATYNIAKELVQLGNQVDVLTSKLPNNTSFFHYEGVTVYGMPCWRNGIHDCGLKGAYSYLFLAAFKLRTLLKIHNYDLLHYFFSLPTGLLTFLPWVPAKIPYVVSLRGSDVPNYDVYNKKVNTLHAILKPINKYIWKKGKSVVALSQGLRETALATAPTQAIEVIPNGVETDIFKPVNEKTQDDGTLTLIAVSRLIERKGVQHVLKALGELNDKSIRLIVVGTGNFEDKLKSLCHTLGLEDTVTFRGYCAREELPPLYNQSDVFILPSMAESFGIVFAEAMACELPIIGGRTGGVPELVREENGILVEPGNVKDIKQAIVRMKDSPNMRKAMGQANRARVVNYYSWRRTAQDYLGLYEKSKQ